MDYSVSKINASLQKIKNQDDVFLSKKALKTIGGQYGDVSLAQYYQDSIVRTVFSGQHC